MASADTRPKPPDNASGPAGAPIGRPATPKVRPDPRPMRLALGAGTFAAVSIMAAGMIRFPVADVEAASSADVSPIGTTEVISAAQPEIRIKHKTVYVHLKRGQKAPKGAKVIEGKAPPPRVVVTRVAGKPAATRQVRSAPRKVAKTRQSGR